MSQKVIYVSVADSEHTWCFVTRIRLSTNKDATGCKMEETMIEAGNVFLLLNSFSPRDSATDFSESLTFEVWLA